MADDAKARLMEAAWGGSILTIGGDEMAEAFPGGFEEACEWCARNGMTIAANGEADWTIERTPVEG